MSDDRPLFDDEELPSWLTNAGITGGGQEGQPDADAQPASTDSNSSEGDLGWLDDASADLNVAGDAAPWMQDSAPVEPAVAAEDLPPWMTQLQDSASPTGDQSSARGTGDEPPWMQHVVSNTDTDAESPADAVSDAASPWAQDDASQPGISPFEDFAWLHTDAKSPDISPFADTGTLNAMAAGVKPSAGNPADKGNTADKGNSQQSAFGGTGALPWKQDAGSAESSGAGNDDQAPSWVPANEQTPEQLAEQFYEPSTEPSSEPSNNSAFGGNFGANTEAAFTNSAATADAVDAGGSYDWLDSGSQDLPAASSEPEPDAPQEPPAAPEPIEPPRTIRPLKPVAPPAEASSSGSDTPPVIKRLPSAEPPPAETSAETPVQPTQSAPIGPIKRLPSAQEPEPPQPDYSNMTYEEWDRQQQAEEDARNNPVDEDLINAVPDWIGGNEPQASSNQSGPEYMPDWFMGMEEQSPDDAPDWFKNTDLTGTPLVGPDSVAKMKDSAPLPPLDDDVPDWFKGSDATVEGIDFEKMFVTDAPPELEQKSLSSLLPMQPAEDTAKTESTENQASEAAMPDDVDFAVLPESDTEATPEPVAEAAEPATISDVTPEPEIEMPASVDTSSESAGQTDDELDWMSEMPDPESANTGTANAETVNESPNVQESAVSDWPAEASGSLDWLTNDTPESDQAGANDVAEGEVPDWMSAMASGAVDQGESATASTADIENTAEAADTELTDFEMPDWFEQTPTSESVNEPMTDSVVDNAVAFDADTPEWLRDMPTAGSTADAGQAAAPANEPGGEPVGASGEFDWLSDFPGASGSGSGSADSTPSSDQSSDWMSGMPDFDLPDMSQEPAQEAESAHAAESDAYVASTDGAAIDIDALLNSTLPPVQLPPSQPMPAASTASTDFDLDAVLGAPDAQTPLTYANEPGNEPQTVPGTAQSLADLFAEDDDDSGAASSPQNTGRLERSRAGRPGTESPSTPEQPAGQVPEWVSDLQPTGGPIVLRVGQQEVRFQDQPLNQLPDNIRRLRERAKAVGQNRPATDEAITTGPLAGVSGAIEVVADSVQPRIVIGDNAPLIVSDLDARRIKLIQNILGVEEELLKERATADDGRDAKPASGAITSVPIRSRVKVDRFIVTLLLAVAIIAPFFLRGVNLIEQPNAASLTAVQQKAQQGVFAAVDGVQASQSVLVAFEYGPTAAAELDDLARAVIRDLIKHGAQPILVSTNPSGILHARGLMQTLSTNPAELALMGRADKPLVANQDYVILRYLAGSTVGVRSFTNAVLSGDFKQFAVQTTFQNDIEGRPTSLTDVSVVSMRGNPAFLLAETPEDVRVWVEQYQSAAPLPPLKLVLLSSASASAVSQTYASSAADRIIGPLVGLRDAMIYQSARQPLTEKAQTLSVQRWNSLALAILLATLIILVGAAINVVRNLRRRVSG